MIKMLNIRYEKWFSDFLKVKKCFFGIKRKTSFTWFSDFINHFRARFKCRPWWWWLALFGIHSILHFAQKLFSICLAAIAFFAIFYPLATQKPLFSSFFLSHNWFCFSLYSFLSLFFLRGLQEDFDKETVLRKLFWKARAKARKDLKEQLSEFRDKRVAGLGSIYGPPGQLSPKAGSFYPLKLFIFYYFGNVKLCCCVMKFVNAIKTKLV